MSNRARAGRNLERFYHPEAVRRICFAAAKRDFERNARFNDVCSKNAIEHGDRDRLTDIFLSVRFAIAKKLERQARALSDRKDAPRGNRWLEKAAERIAARESGHAAYAEESSQAIDYLEDFIRQDLRWRCGGGRAAFQSTPSMPRAGIEGEIDRLLSSAIPAHPHYSAQRVHALQAIHASGLAMLDPTRDRRRISETLDDIFRQQPPRSPPWWVVAELQKRLSAANLEAKTFPVSVAPNAQLGVPETGHAERFYQQLNALRANHDMSLDEFGRSPSI